ncbi:MAG TPA: heme-binding protein [Vicinamibacterales bacterium]|nr:heme-binding protein [Vicinamibacterales bacterium]
MQLKTVLVAAALAGAVPMVAHGQILTERNISLQLALQVANAAMAQCKADGYDVTAAVVDRAGDLKVLLRADTANPHNADLARRKAYTSRTFKVPSMEVAKRTNGPTDLSGQRYLVDIIPLGGGLPINVGNDTIGAIGISGSPNQEGDEKCASAALASVASSLK